jgi:hypothetical protein
MTTKGDRRNNNKTGNELTLINKGFMFVVRVRSERLFAGTDISVETRIKL